MGHDIILPVSSNSLELDLTRYRKASGFFFAIIAASSLLLQSFGCFLGRAVSTLLFFIGCRTIRRGHRAGDGPRDA